MYHSTACQFNARLLFFVIAWKLYVSCSAHLRILYEAAASIASMVVTPLDACKHIGEIPGESTLPHITVQQNNHDPVTMINI